MFAGGGFFLDAGDVGPSSAAQAGHDEARHNLGDEHDGPIEVRKLSQKQETRLMDYLDDALLEINRGYSKRYTAPKTSQVASLEAFLERYDAVLSIIASIPPMGPSAALLVSYLLRVTSEIADGIQGYELRRAGPSRDAAKESDNQRVERLLDNVVVSIAVLDRLWAAVLRGQMLQYRVAKENARLESAADPASENARDDVSATKRDDEGEQSIGSGRYPRIHPTRLPRDVRTIVGTKGISTVPQTQRIRLRNIIVLARDCLFTWMRAQLDAPPPPLMEETGHVSEQVRQEEERTNQDFHIDTDVHLAGRDAEQAADSDTVLIADGGSGEQEQMSRSTHNGIEQEHYNDLFSRKLDPDESDEEEEHENGDDLYHGKASRRDGKKRKVEDAIDGQVPFPPKHARTVASPAPTAQSTDASSSLPQTLPNEDDDGGASLATLGGTGAPLSKTARVLRWDVAFAHLFSRTLRILSDIQDRMPETAEDVRAELGGPSSSRQGKGLAGGTVRTAAAKANNDEGNRKDSFSVRDKE